MARTSSTNSIEKVCAVLRAVASGSDMRLVDIADHAKLNKASALRILKTLGAEGFIRRGEQGFAYQLGPEMIAAAAMSTGWQRLLADTHQSLATLAERSGDTASLALRIGRDVTFVEKAVGPFPVQASLVVGARVNVAYTSAGVAMLARLPRDDRNWMLEDLSPPREFAGARPISRAQVEAEIAEAERVGYAYLNGRLIDEAASVGVAIMLNGKPVGAISVSTLNSRLQPRVPEIAKLLRAEAMLIEERMGL